MSIIAGIGLAASAASGILGGIFGGRRRRRAKRRLKRQQKELTDWRDREINTNYLDRADSQSHLRQVREANEEALRGMNSVGLRQGATDEARIAGASRLNKNYAGLVSQLAGIGARHKDNVQQHYMNMKNNNNSQLVQMDADTTDIQNMVSGISNSAGQMISAFGMGGK